MKPEQWIVSADTGISSKTIWSVMMGVEMSWHASPPLDPSDFGRCFRLLVLVPGWRARLPEVAARYPEWAPLIREWDELERLYCKAVGEGVEFATELYQRIQELLKEGRELNENVALRAKVRAHRGKDKQGGE